MPVMYSPAGGNYPYPVRVVDHEAPQTCYKPQGEFPFLASRVGCGGYGEVAPSHPFAGEAICDTGAHV